MTETPEPERSHKAGNGEDSIYWDASKNTYVGAMSLGFTPSGKRRRPKVTGKTKTEVRRKLRDLRKEMESGVKTPANYTVSDTIEDYLARGFKGRDPETVKKCRSLTENHILPMLGKAKLRDLTADDLDDWLDDRADYLATRSLREVLGVLRRAITHAQKRDKVMRNVAELVTVPDGRPGRPSKALTLEQAKAVLMAARGSILHAYIVVSLLIGVRTEEARPLTWDHVHLHPVGDIPPHIEVWRSVRRHGDTKTRKSRRTLALPQQVVAVLENHRVDQGWRRVAAGERWAENDLVFASTVGTPLDASHVRRGFRAIVKRAGLAPEWTPRELRHSFVSLLSDHGIPLEVIARVVGHSSTATTEAVYRKQLRPVITEGAGAMDSIFNYGDEEGETAPAEEG
ncbi:site-specific integrase [Mangrovactinospora gilvigrisea]|uniref:Site-specific integrase n=1 Tax=Mangrovactinospora gilvigrisea TaxID=1428644 RepID=A0A1J7C8J4_9ACTN|nr:site-specific integrase [Mangrovactinospora gilvigrisea]OIV37856.1 site-specific integrase [Mangrovactinospora gilvigrisea]